MNKNEIAVRLVVNDDGSVAIKQFGQTTEQSMKKASQSTTGLNSAMQTLKTNWLAITAGAAAFGLALSKAWSLAEKAADYEERISSIAALGAQYDMSAKQIVEATKNAAPREPGRPSLLLMTRRCMTSSLASYTVTTFKSWLSLSLDFPHRVTTPIPAWSPCFVPGCN